MPNRAPRSRLASLVSLTLFASLLSCGREVTGPGAPGRLAEVALEPVFQTVRLAGTGEARSIASVVDFTRVRVVLLRATGDTAVDRIVEFPPDSTSVQLNVTVTLGTGATSEGEPFSATLKYVNAAGDTVFTGGPVTVTARPAGSGGSQPPPQIPVVYSGRGANAASVAIAPRTPSVVRNQSLAFTATVRDAAQAVITGTPVAFTSSDTTLVRVDLATGAATVPGVRGTARVTVQTLTGQADTATVTIAPTPTAVAVVSGNNQSVRQASAFPLPVRVRVTAADALPVSGSVVAFAVTSGQGSVSAALDTTDASGFAETNWTAGDSAGIATLRATVQGTSLTATATGTQLSSGPTTLTFESQPAAIAAGASLPSIRVVVRDATADTVRAFTGNVTLSLTGGTAGASLLGVRTVAAIGGIVRWDSLTVDRAGTGYRVTATITGGPSAQSGTFDVAASLPSTVTAESGSGQSVLPGTAYPDSLVARVTDLFGAPKAGVTVTWTVLAGGGSVAPPTSLTDVNGRARVRWTAGTGGVQQVRASVGALPPATFTGSVIAVDGPSTLFVTAAEVTPTIGRSLPVTIFLSNPTPAPLTIALAMRDSVAAWGASSVTIPAGGSQVTVAATGLAQGQTWGVVTSSAGTDSLLVSVGLTSAYIPDGPFRYFLLGDTIRTRVVLSDPAPAGGVTVLVSSPDTAAVRVAPGTGRGLQEADCGIYSCNASVLAEAASTADLLAPPGATAAVTIPAGQFIGHLVILPVGITGSTSARLALSAPATFAETSFVNVSALESFVQCEFCSLSTGQTDGLYVALGGELRRSTTLLMRSLDPGIVTLRDSVAVIAATENFSDAPLRAIAVDTGTARIIAIAPGIASDTLLLRVWPRGLEIGGFASPVGLQVGTQVSQLVRLGLLTQNGFDIGPGVAQSTTVTLVSRDTAVVRIDRRTLQFAPGSSTESVYFSGVDVGSTWIVATAPGYPSDSLAITVTGPSRFIYAGPSPIGVGSRYDDVLLQLASTALGSPVPVNLSSSDDNVLRVLNPTVIVPSGTNLGYTSVEGRGVGTATLTASVLGGQPFTVDVSVVQSRVILSSFAFPTSLAPSDPPAPVAAITGIASNGVNVAQNPSDTVRAVLRSSNPAVVEVQDSVITFVPGNYYAVGGLVRGIAPGTAVLVLSTSGRVSDTSAVITVLAPRILLPETTVAGTGTRVQLLAQRSSSTAATLPISITLRSSIGSTLVQPADTFAVGEVNRAITILTGASLPGSTPVNDTLIVAAPGHTPDTTVYVVRRTKVRLQPPLSLTAAAEDTVSAVLTDGSGFFSTYASGTARRFRVTSSDTTVIKVSADTLEFAPGGADASRRIVLRARAPGSAILVTTSLSDPTLPDTVQVQVVAPTLEQPNYDVLSLAMGTTTVPYEQYISRNTTAQTPVWVRLSSSAPAIVSVPDSILIPAGESFAYYEIATGDTVGSAIVTFTATGHEGGTIPVSVTRGTMRTFLSPIPSVGTTSTATAFSTDASFYFVRPRRAATPIRLSVADTTVLRLASDTTSIAAGEAAASITVRGLRAGTSILSVEDRRASFGASSGGTSTFEVRPNRLRLNQPRFLVTTGALSSESAVVGTDFPVDSLWIQVRTLNGRAGTTRDSVLISGDSAFAQLRLRGITDGGTDTVVVSAPGFAPDTAVVRVTRGYIDSESPIPSTLRQGDSVAVTLRLIAPDGLPVEVGPAPIPLTFITPANLDVRLNGATVTSAAFPAGATSLTIHLRGIAVGSGTATVTSPSIVGTSVTISTRAP